MNVWKSPDSKFSPKFVFFVLVLGSFDRIYFSLPSPDHYAIPRGGERYGSGITLGIVEYPAKAIRGILRGHRKLPWIKRRRPNQKSKSNQNHISKSTADYFPGPLKILFRWFFFFFFVDSRALQQRSSVPGDFGHFTREPANARVRYSRGGTTFSATATRWKWWQWRQCWQWRQWRQWWRKYRTVRRNRFGARNAYYWRTRLAVYIPAAPGTDASPAANTAATAICR